MNIRHIRIFPQKILHAKNLLYRCNNSCLTGFNLFTVESITSKAIIQTRKLTQGSIDNPSINIKKSTPPSSTSKGANQGGIPRKTLTGEPRDNPNEKYTPIEATKQCRSYGGAYRLGILTRTPTSVKKNPN